MDIIILTGAKGGIGKTLCALSAVCSQPADARVLVVDLNWTNPDLSRIITRFGNSRTYVWDTLMIWHWNNPNIKWIVARPIYPYALPTTPDHVWGVILQAIRATTEQLKISPNLVIVDTTLHPGNFIPYQVNIPVDSTLTNTLSTLQQQYHLVSLYIWFIWTLSALKNKDGVKAIGGAALNLNSVLGDAFPIDGFQRGTQTSADLDSTFALRVKHLIHVLNPEAIYPQRVIVRWFADRIFEYLGRSIRVDEEPLLIKELDDLARSRVRTDVLPVGDMHKRIESMSMLPERPSLETMYSRLAEDIKATHQNGRPINLYPIPEINGQLRGYTEEFGTNYENDVLDSAELLKSIGPFFKYIKCYINGQRYTDGG